MPTSNVIPASTDAELWSAVADGEATDGEMQSALAAWRQRPDGHATWHAYHLIGDTLRSADLAVPRHRDERLLAGVRARLAAEPVVLAPSTSGMASPDGASAARRRGRLWSGSVAAAAGVGAVGVMVWLTQAPLGGESSGLAQAGGTTAVAARPIPSSLLPVGHGTAAPAGTVPAPAVEGLMLRDSRLDEYFAAHRQLGAGRPMGTPAGFTQAAPEPGAR